MISLAPLIVAFPLIGFLILGLIGSRIKNEKVIGVIGSSAVGFSFILAIAVYFEMLSLPADQRQHVIQLFTWLSSFTGSEGSFSVSAGYLIDQLSITMTLVVTGVGFLIHVYSIGYMHGDKGFFRFFAYLNLFIFAMLNLVLADNFVLLFLGWEGVGLCSYLLIGFWYEKTYAEEAARKAFIVNRIGDFAFMTGMFLIFSWYGSLEFLTVSENAIAEPANSTVSFWIALLLFIGAVGKSAQIPLFVWLPDAMAGPTPVSALIHAATMVTAGVFMVARTNILFALAPSVLMIIAIIGLATALLAATIGLVQNDIKKVLAYSTVSQLGYMFLALGVGAFAAGIFHLITHAFFKALLFLGSGSVIHAMQEQQDIQKMGGLGKYLPITSKTFLIGAIAIAGIPPFAGFFSKDEILWYSFSSPNGSIAFWILGLLGAALTAFYMFRLVFLVFFGPERFDHHSVHPHESPKTMTWPLILLAALSVIGGFIGVPKSLGGGNAIEHWLEPIFSSAQTMLSLAPHDVTWIEYFLMFLSVTVVALMIYLARRFYLDRLDIPERITKRFKGVYKVLLNKYYVDEAYDAVIIKPVLKGSEVLLWKVFDVHVIDLIVNKSAEAVAFLSQKARKFQTGVAQFYALMFTTGILFILIYVFLM